MTLAKEERKVNIMTEPVSGWKKKVSGRDGCWVVQCLFLGDISLSKGATYV